MHSLQRHTLILVLLFFGHNLLNAQQALSGTYTIANGNPGGAFDYADLGDAFDDLEEYGMSGPVTLELYDTGGNFVSTQSYGLGVEGTSPKPVTGTASTAPLVIRAASGHAPVIAGSGAPLDSLSIHYSALHFKGMSFTTVEGLTVANGNGAGIHWSYGTPDSHNIRIAKCRFHNLAGAAIHFLSSGRIHNVVVENNMCWDCGWDSGAGHHNGVIGVLVPGFEWTFRFNTIVHNALWSTGAFYSLAATPYVIDVVDGNVAIINGPEGVFWEGPTHQLPAAVSGNVVHLLNQAIVNLAYPGWQDWQAAGYDLDGLNADPLLVNIAPGQEDLRLSAASPARDLIPAGSVVDDIFGNPRPMGARWDAGAHEYPAPDMEVSFQASAVAYTGSIDVGLVPFIGVPRTFTISNSGQGDLELSGSPPVEVTPGLNCTAATGVQSQPSLVTIPPNGSTTFTLFIQPAAAGPFDLAVSIESNDIAANPFTFTVTGTAIPNGAAQADAVSGFAGFTNGPFVLAVNPGQAVAGAIALTDPEGEDITVTALSPVTAPPAGVVPPTPPGPGQPITLTWGGVADVSNTPGDYDWLVEFHDAGNGTPVAVTVTIRIREPLVFNAPSRLPDGKVGESYSIAVQASGGAGALTYSLAGGSLPPGLAFASHNGAVTGKPEIAGDYTFSVRVEDSIGSQLTEAFELKINPNPTGPAPRVEASCTLSNPGTAALWLLAALALKATTNRRKAARHRHQRKAFT